MSQIHLYQSPMNKTNIFILEEKRVIKEKKEGKKANYRKQIRFLSWNLITGEIKIVINWIPYLVTTLRLYNCTLSYDGTMFICSVADYSIKDYFFQHWCYIINIDNENNKLSEIVKIVVQDTYHTETPIFKNDLNNILRIISYPNYLQSADCKTNLIASSSGKNRIKGNKVNHKWIQNINDSNKKVEVELNKNKIYINGELKYNLDIIN